ncbi:MAG: DNA mismatch repair endonuclease MutL [Planctomycetes bacterium]|nr:DNA mismatch repair endonuclease MutL [Planctomycetota bacterium]
MGQINVLDQNMINMIAAGEVIERPASVVKELLENSIDSGATKITVTIEDGGKKLISITDNGCGMDAEDLTKAFEPHATSKIKNKDDLQNISTLGFRGEALASIASVASVKAVSKTKTSTSASCIEIDCGTKKSVIPCSAANGTTIEVRNLFYKLPVRSKFLKTTNTEMGHITEHFIRIAIANYKLDITLISNGRQIHRLPASDDLSRRIAELFSVELSENLIKAERNERGVQISALLGKPEISRTNNKFQYTFLNGRFIRDKAIFHAIKQSYHGSLEPNRFPVVFLFIQMPYEDYDVNVHPTKIEVRFYNTNLIHSQILSCLREKILETDFDINAKLPEPSATNNQHFTGIPNSTSSSQYRNQKVADSIAEFFEKHKPIQTQQQQLGFHSKIATGRKTENIINQAETSKELKAMQIQDSFIIVETKDGFIIIDQHALHERIIYEDLRRRFSVGKIESQKCLYPESFKVTPRQIDLLKTNAEMFEKLGIELEPFGPQTYAIQAFPVLLAKAEPVKFVGDLLDLLDNKNADFDADKLLDEVLNMIACKAAIKAGQKLSSREIEQLLADKDITEYASRCPHGRPTTIKFSTAELEKQFKRT